MPHTFLAQRVLGPKLADLGRLYAIVLIGNMLVLTRVIFARTQMICQKRTNETAREGHEQASQKEIDFLIVPYRNALSLLVSSLALTVCS
jgi:hypothetical protein